MKSKYCIIGAGFCGLGVAKAFLDYGIEFDCFEKNEEIGGNWLNGVYDSTHIISSRDNTHFTDFPMPRDYPDFPSRDQILAYLKSYTDTFKLRRHIQFNTEVSHISPIDYQGLQGWNVRLSTGEVRHYTGVIVANGHHWNKRYPNYPGEFTGKVLHSKDYKNNKDFEGRRVLVVGAGNSGCDISVEAALNGFESSMSMRRGYYFLPKTVFGIPTAEIDQPWIPFFAQKLLMKSLLKISHGSNKRYGLAKPDHDLYDHHPIINSQLLYFIRHGRVKPKPDISRFEGRTVHFKDGTQGEFDTLVYATGYNVSFPFLDSKYFEWENGYPKRIGTLMAPRLAGLYIFGLSQPRGGAGPLITGGSRLLAEIILTQELMDHPISDNFARYRAPSAKMLVGVYEVHREIKLARFLVRRWYKKHAKSKGNLPLLTTRGQLPQPRNPKFIFGAEIPKHWIKHDGFQTHLANSLNLIFPYGERSFIRAVRAYSEVIDHDPKLKERVANFFAQEVQHGRQHENFSETLKIQGFDVDRFLKRYEKIFYKILEPRLSPAMNLAKTAALEHYTAAFAEHTLKTEYLKNGVHPRMRELFEWHAAEEIEHKSVAYDVLLAAKIPYSTRIGGLLLGSAALTAAWTMGTFTLLKQDSDVTFSSLTPEVIKGIPELSRLGISLGRAFLQYLRPGFHPDQNDTNYLAVEILKTFDREQAAH